MKHGLALDAKNELAVAAGTAHAFNVALRYIVQLVATVGEFVILARTHIRGELSQDLQRGGVAVKACADPGCGHSALAFA
jgi:hypothetical protein